MSSHSGPTPGICTTWSITEMAVRSRPPRRRGRRGAGCRRAAGASPGNSKRPRWRVKRRGTGASRWVRALDGRGEEAGRDERERLVAGEVVHGVEALGGEAVGGGRQRAQLRGDDLRRHRVAAGLVAGARLALGHVEHDERGPGRSRRRAMASHAARRSALEPGGVDDGREAAPQARVDDLVEHREGVLRRSLVALVQSRPPPAGRPTTRSAPARSARAAHVDFPLPDTPTSTTRHGSGRRVARPGRRPVTARGYGACIRRGR